jgi:hypothetical protein
VVVIASVVCVVSRSVEWLLMSVYITINLWGESSWDIASFIRMSRRSLDCAQMFNCMLYRVGGRW